jgi:hypothetical protein
LRIGLHIIADHGDMSGGQSGAVSGKLKETGRRFAEHGCNSARGIFKRRNKRARVEAELEIAIEEIAIFRKRKKLGAMDDLPVCGIQQFVSRTASRIADDDRLAAACAQPSKVLASIWMHEEKRGKIMMAKIFPCRDRGREDVVGFEIEPEAGEIIGYLIPGPAGCVGNESQRNAQLLNPVYGLERTCQDLVANANDALNIEQYALYTRAFVRAFHLSAPASVVCFGEISCLAPPGRRRVMAVEPALQRYGAVLDFSMSQARSARYGGIEAT